MDGRPIHSTHSPGFMDFEPLGCAPYDDLPMIRLLYIDRGERGAAADQIGGFLGDHADRRIDIAADEVRHHGGVAEIASLRAQ